MTSGPIMKAALFAALLGGFLPFAASCSRRTPDPKDETVRRPNVLVDTQVGEAGKEISFELVSKMPDPEYKADRLNPDRYKTAALSFSCAAYCPEGLSVDVSSGHVAWTPAHEAVGVYYTTFRVESGVFSTDAVIEIIVRDVDRPVPSGVVELVAAEGVELLYDIAAKDPDGDPTRFTCSENCPPGAKVEGARFSWTPPYDAEGVHDVQIYASSRPESRPIVRRGSEVVGSSLEEDEAKVIDRGKTLTSVLTLRISVANTPRPPILRPPKTPLSVVEMEVLTYTPDIDNVDGEDMTFKCGASCPEGVIVDFRTGSILWMPNYGQAGSYDLPIDVFSRGSLAATLRVPVTVIHKNRPPVWLRTTSVVHGREGELLTFDFAALDPDKDDVLLYGCEGGCPAGLLFVPGGVAWIPNFDQSGVYNIVISVTDGLERITSPVKITIDNVNRPPRLTPLPTSLAANAGFPFTYNVMARDDDGDVLYYSLSCPGGCPAGLGISPVGKITWTPTFAQNGVWPVTVTVSDGAASVSDSTSITVFRTDRPPRFDPLSTIEGREEVPLLFTLRAVDPDGDAVTYYCVAVCPAGLTVDPTTGVVSWTPNDHQAGIYTVGFRAKSSPIWDNTLFQNTDMIVRFIIRHVNRPPTIANITGGLVYENGHLTSSESSETGHDFEAMLAGDDPDGDPLLYSCYSGCPDGLTVDPVTGTVRWRPSYSQGRPSPYSGIIFQVSDGEYTARTAPISITVMDVNRRPVWAAVSDQSVVEDSTLSLVLPVADPDGDPLSLSCQGACPFGLGFSGGKLVWKPGFGQAGTYLLAVKAFDGKDASLSAPFTITVIKNNRPPVFGSFPSSFTVNEMGHADSNDENSPMTSPLVFSAAATDPDGDEITYACYANCPRGMTVDPATGLVSWRPSYTDQPDNQSAKLLNAPYTGIVIVARDADGAETFSKPFSVTVVNVDRAPSVTALSDMVVTEGTQRSQTLAATDPDGDAVTWKCLTVEAMDGSVQDCAMGYNNNFPDGGVSRWLTVSGGTVTLRPLYSDAQRNNLPYLVTWRAESRPTSYPGGAKAVDVRQKIYVVNVDRPGEIRTGIPTVSVKEGEAGGTIVLAAIDEDAYESSFRFSDKVEFFCDPTGPDGCPRGLHVVQSCGVDCDYGLNPTGCPSAGVLADNSCGNLGYVYMSPDFDMARIGNAPYSIKIKMRSYPDGFDSPVVGGPYPPLEVTSPLSFKVINTDRPPEWVGGDPAVTVREPAASCADQSDVLPDSSPCIDETRLRLEAIDPDGSLTEEKPRFVIDGCSDKTGLHAMGCPSWIRIDPATDDLVMRPNTFKDPGNIDSALPNDEARMVNVRVEGCPLPFTGWSCNTQPKRRKVNLVVLNSDRPPRLAEASDIPDSIKETETLAATVRFVDPDGDEIRYKVSGGSAYVYPPPTGDDFYYSRSTGGPVSSDDTLTVTLNKLAPGDDGYDRVRQTTPWPDPSYQNENVSVLACSVPDGWAYAPERCVSAPSLRVKVTNVDRPPTIRLLTSGASADAQWESQCSAGLSCDYMGTVSSPRIDFEVSDPDGDETDLHFEFTNTPPPAGYSVSCPARLLTPKRYTCTVTINQSFAHATRAAPLREYTYKVWVNYVQPVLSGLYTPWAFDPQVGSAWIKDNNRHPYFRTGYPRFKGEDKPSKCEDQATPGVFTTAACANGDDRTPIDSDAPTHISGPSAWPPKASRANEYDGRVDYEAYVEDPEYPLDASRIEMRLQSKSPSFTAGEAYTQNDASKLATFSYLIDFDLLAGEGRPDYISTQSKFAVCYKSSPQCYDPSAVDVRIYDSDRRPYLLVAAMPAVGRPSVVDGEMGHYMWYLNNPGTYPGPEYGVWRRDTPPEAYWDYVGWENSAPQYRIFRCMDPDVTRVFLFNMGQVPTIPFNTPATIVDPDGDVVRNLKWQSWDMDPGEQYYSHVYRFQGVSFTTRNYNYARGPDKFYTRILHNCD